MTDTHKDSKQYKMYKKYTQEDNPLELMSQQSNDQILENASRTITQIAENMPESLTRMYEEDFVRNYLPLFYHDPDNILNRQWLEISSSMMLEVILVDKDDNEVYRVPPFMPTVLPTKDIQGLPIAQLSGDIELALKNNKGYMAMNDIYDVVNGLAKNTLMENHGTAWTKFYDRYNEMISIEDAEGNDLMKIPKKEKSKESKYLDF